MIRLSLDRAEIGKYQSSKIELLGKEKPLSSSNTVFQVLVYRVNYKSSQL